MRQLFYTKNGKCCVYCGKCLSNSKLLSRESGKADAWKVMGVVKLGLGY